MLKYLYKTLLISILCGSILMLDMSYKGQSLRVGMSSVHAETLTTGGGSDADLTSTLTMVAISVIASRLVAYGKLTPDIMLAAAGGLAFMAGDVIASSELKKAMKELQTEIERKDGGDLTDRQRQALIKLRDSYLKAEETAKTKKNLQTAAAVAFLAAAVVAYAAAATETALMQACGAALTASQPASSAIGAACDASSEGTCGGSAQAQSCNALTSALQGSLNAYKAGRLVMAPSCSAMPSVIGTRTPLISQNTSTPSGCGVTAEAVAGAVTACSAVFTGDQMNETGCVPPAILYATTAAAILTMGINSSVLITLIVSLSAPLSQMVDNAIYIPSRRATMWGALAALSYAAVSSTEKQIAEIEGYIKKINDLLDTVNAQANGNTASNIVTAAPTSNSQSVGSINTTVTPYQANGVDLTATNTQIPCTTSDPTKSGCSSFQTQFNNLPTVSGIPAGVGSTISDIVRLGDGLNGASRVSGSTMSTAASLSANAQVLKAILDKQRADYQNKLLKNGSKLNLLNEEAKFQNSMNDAAIKALKDSKMSTKDAFAALGSGIIDPAGLNLKSADGAAEALAALKKANAAKLKAFALPPVLDGQKTKMGAMKLENEKANEKTNEKEVAKIEDQAIDTQDEYEMKNEINSDKDTSIFDVISNRYQKSGYPRLFKKIKE